ncbi:hypothetical protein [Parasphingorhabdus pacifica]
MSGHIAVALEAMRVDARVWEDASSSLTGPKETVAGLTVEPAQVNMCGIDKGIDQTYEAARSGIEDMLGKAAKYFEKLGGDLRDSAEQYESDDKRAQEGLQSIQ